MKQQVWVPVKPKKTDGRKLLQKAEKFRVHDADFARVVMAFYESLDCPVSLSCYMLYKYEEYDQLIAKDVNPRDYIDSDVLRDDYVAVNFLKKNEFLKTSFNKKRLALEAFYRAEEQNRQTNIRIRRYLSGLERPNEWILSNTIRRISRILGDFDIDQVIDFAKWGPGVTLSIKGVDTSGAAKFENESDLTFDTHSLYGPVFSEAYQNWWPRINAVYRRGNSVITVPKNAKIDRTIAVEPGLNSWVQLGIGQLIRSRLRVAGFNLNSDLRNQRAAYIGSIDGSLATVDFKAASDTISTEVVRLLLPPDWFKCLDAARSKAFTLDGKSYTYSQKFSTMGCGFTFELESLIFVSLGLACCEFLGLPMDEVSIFGDDLIIPVQGEHELRKVTGFLGFTINTEKSFFDSAFRESCGSYYHNGVDLKPLYLKKRVRNVKDVYRLANAISALAARYDSCGGRDRRFYRVWSLLVHLLPADLRLYGSGQAGDAVIHSELQECVTAPAPDGWEGFTFPALPSVAVNTTHATHGFLLSKLRGIRSPKFALRSSAYTSLLNHPEFRRRLEKASYLNLQELVSYLFNLSASPSEDNKTPLRGRTKLAYKRQMLVNRWCGPGPWRNVGSA